MKIPEIRKLKKENLEKLLKEKKKLLQKLRFDLAAGKLKNNREIRKTKKEIARILTISKENQLRKGVGKTSGFPEKENRSQSDR